MDFDFELGRGFSILVSLLIGNIRGVPKVNLLVSDFVCLDLLSGLVQMGTDVFVFQRK
jgi:hypothetical protein